ncbi:MAG: AMP-binding protein [Candidatus Saccharibacteria bacterium]|nr:AMP-binding protein [Pseudorhodobacter sp.]
MTSLALVPTQFELFDTTTWLPQLRYITQAGGRLDPVLARRFAEMATEEGWLLFIMYGQTEAGPRMSYLPARDAADWFHTIGRPIPGGSFRLIDATGAEIDQPGVPGELIYEGPNVMLGYALARTDLGAPAGPQILHTGDIAERLNNGYYCIVGRASRFIKLFGLRIGLDEVETRLRSEGHRGYASGTDARLVLFVQDASGNAALRTAVATWLKLPASAVLVEPLHDVPVLASGKVDYRALARHAEALTASHEQVAPDEHSLEGLLKSALSTPVLDLDRSFLDLGGDSLSYLEVQLHLSSRLGLAPAGWERLPLRELLALDVPISAKNTVPMGTLQEVSADLLARVAAIFAVIALHSTTWATGGGSYLLLILAGYSLARFQSSLLFDGRVLQTCRSMLLPIMVCYYILIGAIALFRPPIDPGFFLLVENFVPRVEPRGLTPYWYVSTYVQIILIATLPFAVPGLRRTIAAHPLVAGCVALVGSVVVMHLAGLVDIAYTQRHHHPVPALQLLLMGWCAFFASSLAQRAVVSLLILGLWWGAWGDAPTGIALFALTGAGAVVWGLRVPLFRGVTRGLMRIGSLTLFLYLLHVPVMVLVLPRMSDQPEALQLAVVIALTLIASALSKLAYDRTAARLQGLLT